ncbi:MULTISPECIES: hypothetical protein [unclassified Rhizobium]|uniref:hypothetical protein n=1 Tax=unclassified Rhizobium TaxID=2613769 RepID=UPI000BDA985B|nr:MULTISPECIES: hypothetical protein [unclassified Rhizobium]MDH7805519.1 hypothetical protein [Rhizobium sp. AN67]MDQ4407029.1 hypothetical protein [Rhizobium sp. AN63]SOD60246.1 hypothetical protein SAMN05216595_5159 [Rhizobium sp. AN6A]
MRTPSLKRLRGQAERLGLRIERSSAKVRHIHNVGRYRLVRIENESVVAGARWELELTDIRDELRRAGGKR